MALNEKQAELCESSVTDYSDLRAIFLNCTLKRSPEMSHTEGLITISRGIMEKKGIACEVLRPVDHDIGPRTSTPVPADPRTTSRIATRPS